MEKLVRISFSNEDKIIEEYFKKWYKKFRESGIMIDIKYKKIYDKFVEYYKNIHVNQ